MDEVQVAFDTEVTVTGTFPTDFVDTTVLVTFSVKVEMGTVTVNESTEVRDRV